MICQYLNDCIIFTNKHCVSEEKNCKYADTRREIEELEKELRENKEITDGEKDV